MSHKAPHAGCRFCCGWPTQPCETVRTATIEHLPTPHGVQPAGAGLCSCSCKCNLQVQPRLQSGRVTACSAYSYFTLVVAELGAQGCCARPCTCKLDILFSSVANNSHPAVLRPGPVDIYWASLPTVILFSSSSLLLSGQADSRTLLNLTCRTSFIVSYSPLAKATQQSPL